MKSYLYALILFLLPLAGLAQTTYLIQPIPYNPDPFTSGNQILANLDDVHSASIPMPFSFCFYDSTFDHLIVSSNGYISFDTSFANTFSPWPINSPAPQISGLPNYLIMAPYHDIDPASGGQIRYDTAGIAPYRRFIVSFYQAAMFSCNNLLFTQQVILYETTNVIETHIQDKPTCTSWNGGAAIHGLMKDTSTAHIVPGRNFPTQWTANLEGYRFAPDGPCAGPAATNLIGGQVWADYNNNCIFDAGDAPIANRAVLVDGGAYYDWTDATGNYLITVDTGNWNVNQLISPYYANNCAPAAGYNVSLPLQNTSSLANDFSDSILVYCADLQVYVGTSGLTTCQHEMGGIAYGNQGTVPDSNVTITLTLDDSLTLDSAGIPFTQVGNTYTFNVGNLNPGQAGSIPLYFTVGCDSIGTVYCMNTSITGTAGVAECDSTNNQDTLCQPLTGAYDPNDKRVASQDFTTNGWVSDEDITATDQLSYMIRFQNTGNDTAYSVRIMDTLAPGLNSASVIPGASSHFYQIVVIGDVVIFEFPDILLVDSLTNPLGSQGFVQFSVKQTPGNPIGTVIENEASIFFDQNAPIITGLATVTIPVTVGLSTAFDNEIVFYPNPGTDQLKIDWKDGQGEMSISLRNLLGQEVLSTTSQQPQATLATNRLPRGSYLLEVRSGNQIIGKGLWIKE